MKCIGCCSGRPRCCHIALLVMVVGIVAIVDKPRHRHIVLLVMVVIVPMLSWTILSLSTNIRLFAMS